jgi:hypothetical protein
LRLPFQKLNVLCQFVSILIIIILIIICFALNDFCSRFCFSIFVLEHLISFHFYIQFGPHVFIAICFWFFFQFHPSLFYFIWFLYQIWSLFF